MATYSTDLTTLTTAEAGTTTEFASPYNAGGAPGQSGEQFIQGTDCYSQNTGNKGVGLTLSLVYDHGAGVTFAADEVVFAWLFYFAGTNLESYANSGWRFGIGSSVSAWDWFRVGGSDYGSQKYGGWFNFAIDPTATETGTVGGGNGGTYQFFGNVPYTLNAVTKGDPVAFDALRYGRGVISITGTGGSFTELAQYNDYNAGGTPPGTSSTSIDTGRHVLGLFQAAGGGFLWKGLLSMGVTATSVTFTDSNQTITIDDCPHTYAAFNKIEFHNSASSVTWNNITFVSTATTANGIGNLEMIDNATVTLNGCSFNDMGTFVFLSNGTADTCNFNNCAQITAGGADLRGSNVSGYTGTAGTGAVLYDVTGDPDGELDNMSFTKGTISNHAIEFDATNSPTTITLRGIDFSGYNATNGNTDSALYFPSTTKSYTVNLVGCTGNISYRVGTGGSVTLVADPVTVSVKVTDADLGTNIQNARVLVWVTDSSNFFFQQAVSITGTGTTATVTHTAHGLITNDNVKIEGAAEDVYNGAYTVTVTGVNTYTYTTNETIATSPATGSPTSTFVFINGLTDVNGEISDSRVVSVSQPVNFRVRKYDASPYYRQSNGSRTVNNSLGLSIGASLVSDE